MTYIFLLIGYFLIFLKYCLDKNALNIHIRPKKIFIILFIWTILSFTSFLIGFFKDDPRHYVVGDFYNFLMLPLVFLLAYFIINKEEDIKLLVKGVITIYSFFLIFDFIKNFNLIIEGQKFTTLAFGSAGGILILQLFLFLEREKTAWSIYNICLMGFSFFALVVCQNRNSILVFLIGLISFLVIYPRRFKKLLKFGIIVSIIILLIFILSGSMFIMHFSGLKTRLLLIGQSNPTVGILGMGKRIPETLGIFQEFLHNPLKSFFGFGMGSSLETSVTVAGISFDIKAHNPHSGILQIFFRLGISGFAVALFYILFFLRKAVMMKYSLSLAGLVAIIIITEVLGGGVLYSNILLHALCGGLLGVKK